MINLKRLSLTDFTVDIQVGARQGVVASAWKKADVTAQWEKTTWAQKRAAKSRRAEMSDFDRFKLMKARKRVSFFFLFIFCLVLLVIIFSQFYRGLTLSLRRLTAC